MSSEPEARIHTSASPAQSHDDVPAASGGPERTGPSRWGRIAEILVALGVIALGIIVLIQTQDIRVSRAMARIGPRVIPTIVGGGLIVIGVWYAIEVLRDPASQISTESEDVDPTLPPDWSTIAGVGAGLVVYMLTIERLGFVIASALLFIITAVSMGSRSWLRDGAFAILLATGVYVAFSTGLGVRLPEGVLEGVL